MFVVIVKNIDSLFHDLGSEGLMFFFILLTLFCSGFAANPIVCYSAF